MWVDINNVGIVSVFLIYRYRVGDTWNIGEFFFKENQLYE